LFPLKKEKTTPFGGFVFENRFHIKIKDAFIAWVVPWN